MSTPTGFTRPETFGIHITAPRLAGLAVFTGVWAAATWGRLHPVAVAIPPLLAAVAVLATVYRVAATRWAGRWMHWRRHRTDLTGLPDPSAAVDVSVDGAGDIGVMVDGDHLITMIELHPDPLAPAVVTDTEERTPNTVSVARLADLLELADVELESFDLIADGARAAGGFADLYQQGQGPVPAAARRASWLVLRVGMLDNVGAISRRAVRPDAARRTAAVACLRAADQLAAEGLDARPATAAQIRAVNDALHADPPVADHWSHLEGRDGFAGVFYADPDHIAEDAAQWWTWAHARDVTTLIRVRPAEAGHAQIAALVRYRTAGAPPAPPVSRLGPLYGVQRQAWSQFRVGALPADGVMAFQPLATQDPVIPFGPTGPMIGTLPGQKAGVYLPLVAPIVLGCPYPLQLRQIALRATATGRPLIVISPDRAAWESIAARAVTGAVLPTLPDELPDDAILVIDGPMPADVPEVTVLTSDPSYAADITISDAGPDGEFTLTVRTGLTARLRSMPGHEERRLLGTAATPPVSRPAPRRPAAPTAIATAAPSPSAARGEPLRARTPAPASAPAPRAGSPSRRTAAPTARNAAPTATAAPAVSHFPPTPDVSSAWHTPVTVENETDSDVEQRPVQWPNG